MAAWQPPGLKRFMAAVGKVESGGRYTARNPVSGAYGKYQIMPANWPSWARTYLGNAKAPQTPSNQEKVAAGKFTSLYKSLGSWRRVAYWWLTGSKQTSGWSAYATRYVNKVMGYYRNGTGPVLARAKVDGKRYGEKSGAIEYTGTWRSARHAAYAGDAVKYATKGGASATFTFTGTRISWYGPDGPTRGSAKVFVDGKLVKTVDLHDRSFTARTLAFRKSWKSASKHTIEIVVVGSKGHPMVAIDEFVVMP